MLFLKAMLAAIYIKNRKDGTEADPRFTALRDSLASAGWELYDINVAEDIREGTGLILSVGGDGTFLSAAKRVSDKEIPIVGVNLGRLGFLSENSPEDLSAPLLAGEYKVEDRSLLEVAVEGEAPAGLYPYALNEVCIHRSGAGVIGIKVEIDGVPLPVYWADGLLVATSSGSTAYSLSAGGPICMPEARVLVIAPVAPHNLNVRPLVVPDTSRIKLSVISRDGAAMLSLDNRSHIVKGDLHLSVSVAQFSLKRVRLDRTNFVKALTGKLFWGEDVRNGSF